MIIKRDRESGRNQILSLSSWKYVRFLETYSINLIAISFDEENFGLFDTGGTRWPLERLQH